MYYLVQRLAENAKLSGPIFDGANTELLFFERTIFPKDVFGKLNWKFELGVESGMNDPIIR